MISYTPNQTGAIACLLSINMWGSLAWAVAPYVSSTHPPFYPILLIVFWVLLPFYIKLSRHAFMVGIVLIIFVMSSILISPILYGGTKWYLFTRGFYDFMIVTFYLIALAHIYFSYKSFREVSI